MIELFYTFRVGHAGVGIGGTLTGLGVPRDQGNLSLVLIFSTKFTVHTSNENPTVTQTLKSHLSRSLIYVRIYILIYMCYFCKSMERIFCTQNMTVRFRLGCDMLSKMKTGQD